MSTKSSTGDYAANTTLSSSNADYDLTVVESDVVTNHFPCKFASNVTFYQYAVSMEEYHENQGRFVELQSREKCRQFLGTLIENKSIHPTAVCWYDEGKCLYSTTDFSDYFKHEQTMVCEDGRYKLTIHSLSATCSTNDILENNDQTLSAVRIIETLLKQSLKNQFKAVRNVFYPYHDGSHAKAQYQTRLGFYQSLCLTESGPTMNLDTTSTRFYPHADLLPYIWEQLLGQSANNFHGIIHDNDYYSKLSQLAGVEVTTKQSKHQKVYVLTGQFAEYLPEQTFIDNSGTGERQNLLKYYKDLGYDLQFPKLYCMKAHALGKKDNTIDLPIELCCLREWQEVNDDRLNPIPAPLVHDRYYSILNAIQSCRFDDELCREIELQVSCTRMMPLPYEVLRKPNISLGLRQGFVQPIAIHSMAYIYLADPQRYNTKDVQNNLLITLNERAKQRGMSLPQQPDSSDVLVDKHFEQNLRDTFNRLKDNGCELVLCLENSRDPNAHDLFKQIAYTEYGLVTQCVSFAKIAHRRNLNTYCDMLLLSINTKLSGENKIVENLTTNNDPTTTTMFFGADVEHPKNNRSGEQPSIAACVAGMNVDCSVTNQRVSQQWPRTGRQSEEAILLLEEMTTELLKIFVETTGLPQQVVFFRDGVDDGQFQRVLDEEVTALKRAFRSVYNNNNMPLLTFIIVKKRHHTRLFKLSKNTSVSNVSPGTVIDSDITAPISSTRMHFFLNSHEALKGTNQIGNYVVLVNEIGYTLEEIEDLTYALCHTDQRSTTAEAIPSLVHLADRAASNTRKLFLNSTRPNDGSRAVMLEVHEDVQNKPNMF